MRRRAIVLSISVSALFLWLSFRSIDRAVLFSEIARVSLAILSLSLLSKLGWFLTAAIRSKVLFGPVGNVSWQLLFKSLILGSAVNNVLVLRAGEIARIDYIARHAQLSRSFVLGVVALERLLDLIVLLIVFLLVLPLVAMEISTAGSLALMAIGLVSALAIVTLISRHPATFSHFCAWLASSLGVRVSTFVKEKSESFARGLAALRTFRRIGVVTILSVAVWANSAISVFIWLRAFDLHLPWYAPLFILGCTAFGAALPASPANVGTYHYFLIWALVTLGVSQAVASSVAIVGHAIAYIPFTLAGLPLILGHLSILRRGTTVSER